MDELALLDLSSEAGKRGRPKGSKQEGWGKGKEDEKTKITLGWVGVHKKHKTPWETDAEFRKVFLEQGLPVRQCTNLSGGSLQRIYDHDLGYVK